MSSTKYTDNSAQILLRAHVSKLAGALNNAGIYHSIQSRVKSSDSGSRKVQKKRATATHEDYRIQDHLGIRVNVYFSDDIEVVHAIAGRLFQPDSAAPNITRMQPGQFGVKLHNCVYRAHLDADSASAFPEHADQTFELQLRTIHNEGWHEIDHDFVYKAAAADTWQGRDDKMHAFTALQAMIEAVDWSVSKLFDGLAHDFYRAGRVRSMVQFQFRIRYTLDAASAPLLEFVLEREGALKAIHRLHRRAFLEVLALDEDPAPLTADNVLAAATSCALGEFEQVASVASPYIRKWLQRISGRYSDLVNSDVTHQRHPG